MTEQRFKTATPGYRHPDIRVPADTDPPRSARRWLWIGLALIVVAAGTFAGTRWALDRHEVTAWRVTTDLPIGTELGADVLEPVRIDSTALGETTLTDTTMPQGFTRTAAPEDTLLHDELVADQPPQISTTEAVVGLALNPAQAPTDDLAPGDLVTIWELPPDDASPRRLDKATRLASDVVVRGTTSTGDGTLLTTLTAPRELSKRLTALSAQGRVALTRP